MQQSTPARSSRPPLRPSINIPLPCIFSGHPETLTAVVHPDRQAVVIDVGGEVVELTADALAGLLAAARGEG
jgi:hypothetical protein